MKRKGISLPKRNENLENTIISIIDPEHISKFQDLIVMDSSRFSTQFLIENEQLSETSPFSADYFVNQLVLKGKFLDAEEYFSSFLRKRVNTSRLNASRRKSFKVISFLLYKLEITSRIFKNTQKRRENKIFVEKKNIIGKLIKEFKNRDSFLNHSTEELNNLLKLDLSQPQNLKTVFTESLESVIREFKSIIPFFSPSTSSQQENDDTSDFSHDLKEFENFFNRREFYEQKLIQNISYKPNFSFTKNEMSDIHTSTNKRKRRKRKNTQQATTLKNQSISKNLEKNYGCCWLSFTGADTTHLILNQITSITQPFKPSFFSQSQISKIPSTSTIVTKSQVFEKRVYMVCSRQLIVTFSIDLSYEYQTPISPNFSPSDSDSDIDMIDKRPKPNEYIIENLKIESKTLKKYTFNQNENKFRKRKEELSVTINEMLTRKKTKPNQTFNQNENKFRRKFRKFRKRKRELNLINETLNQNQLKSTNNNLKGGINVLYSNKSESSGDSKVFYMSKESVNGIQMLKFIDSTTKRIQHIKYLNPNTQLKENHLFKVMKMKAIPSKTSKTSEFLIFLPVYKNIYRVGNEQMKNLIIVDVKTNEFHHLFIPTEQSNFSQQQEDEKEGGGVFENEQIIDFDIINDDEKEEEEEEEEKDKIAFFLIVLFHSEKISICKITLTTTTQQQKLQINMEDLPTRTTTEIKQRKREMKNNDDTTKKILGLEIFNFSPSRRSPKNVKMIKIYVLKKITGIFVYTYYMFTNKKNNENDMMDIDKPKEEKSEDEDDRRFLNVAEFPFKYMYINVGLNSRVFNTEKKNMDMTNSLVVEDDLVFNTNVRRKGRLEENEEEEEKTIDAFLYLEKKPIQSISSKKKKKWDSFQERENQVLILTNRGLYIHKIVPLGNPDPKNYFLRTEKFKRSEFYNFAKNNGMKLDDISPKNTTKWSSNRRHHDNNNNFVKHEKRTRRGRSGKFKKKNNWSSNKNRGDKKGGGKVSGNGMYHVWNYVTQIDDCIILGSNMGRVLFMKKKKIKKKV